MTFVGRTSEQGRLRAALDRPSASLIRVSGIRGGGKTALVRRVLGDYDHLTFTAPPLPDQALRSALAGTVDDALRARGLDDLVGAPPTTWNELFAAVLRLAVPSRPFVLVIDDAHRLAEARSRYRDALVSTLGRAADTSTAFHAVIVGPAHADDDASLVTPSEHTPATTTRIEVGPLAFRTSVPLLPGTRAPDVVLAYAVFGGIPRVLRSLDRDVTVGTNIRRLMLTEGATWSDVGARWLERDVQSPARYYAVLAALAGGEAAWSTVHAGVPELGRSGQLAPYLKRLQQLGLIVARRSLDARPGSRATRYAIADAFLAFWVRFLLSPRQGGARSESDVYAAHIRPALDDHVATIFPSICRQYMRHDAIETLDANAREEGSLWGDGYDIRVAGILSSGAAYYGTCRWQEGSSDDSILQTLDAQMRETRYGFGRQVRQRIVFTGAPASRALQREVARRHDATLIDLGTLLGED